MLKKRYRMARSCHTMAREGHFERSHAVSERRKYARTCKVSVRRGLSMQDLAGIWFASFRLSD
jgi:hypothetical protein